VLREERGQLLFAFQRGVSPANLLRANSKLLIPRRYDDLQVSNLFAEAIDEERRLVSRLVLTL
jgi:hypothetical protein